MGEIEQSAGSADAEMSIIRDSWDYKLNALKETWTKTFQEMADRGAIGDLTDLLTGLSEAISGLVSSSVGLPALVGTLTGLVATVKGNGRSKLIDFTPRVCRFAV